MSSRERCDPVAGFGHPMYHSGAVCIPATARPRFTVCYGGAASCAPWRSGPATGLRRAPYNHPDFTGNAREDLFRGLLKNRRMDGSALNSLTSVPLAPLGVASLLHLLVVPGGFSKLKSRRLIVHTLNGPYQGVAKFAGLLDAHCVRLPEWASERLSCPNGR